MKRSLMIVPVLVAAALLVLFVSQRRTGPVFVSGFLESHQIRVGSRVGGRVQQVHVVEGQRVAAGTPLVALEPHDLEEKAAEARFTLAAHVAQLEKLRAGARPQELEAARAALDRARAVLRKLIAGPRLQEIRAQEARLAQAQAELVKARQDYDRVRALSASGQASEEEMNTMTRGLNVAQAVHDAAEEELALLLEGTRAEDIAEQRARVAEAEAALALLEAGSRREDIAAAEAQVAAYEARVAAIQKQLEELVVVAPVESIVEALDLRPGDLLAPSAPVVSLADPSELWVRAYVPETRLALHLGQEIPVRVFALGERIFRGHISFIAREAEFTPSNVQTPEERSKQVFRIKVMLDEGLDVLRAGMSADVLLETAP